MKAVSAGLWSLAVAFALGAFGTHSLKSRIEPEMLEVFKTGQVYHVWGSLTLIGLCAAAGTRAKGSGGPLGLIGAGTLVVAGSLCLLALSGTRVWGAVTPVGGVLLILGTCWAGWSFAHPGHEKAPNGRYRSGHGSR